MGVNQITLTLIRQMTPGVIGGFQLLKQFGVHFQYPVIEE